MAADSNAKTAPDAATAAITHNYQQLVIRCDAVNRCQRHVCLPCVWASTLKRGSRHRSVAACRCTMFTLNAKNY